MPWFEKKFNRGNSREDETYSSFHHVRRHPLFSLSVTGKIILANVLFFLGFYVIFLILGTTPEKYAALLSNTALQPLNILEGKKLWTLFTHMFMHAGISHLLMNMLSMVFIGSFVEKLLGKKRFFWLYIMGGIVSAIFFVTLAGFFGTTPIGEKLFGNPLTFAVGASGAIFALGGLLAMLTPRMKVLVFFIIPMPMWVAMTFFMGFFWILSYVGGIPIGNSAHLGGLVTGLAYGIYLKHRYPKKTRMISRFFS
jgi:hypothetical protein